MALITIDTAEAPRYLWHVMSRGLVPMLTSSPGIGKSSIAKQIAATNNLKVIDLRLSQADPTDMNGFPMINESKTKAAYVPMDTFPIEGDALATETRYDSKGVAYTHTYDGWFLLLDEMNSAPLSVQAAAYKVVLDKEVGLHKLHEKVYIMGAGNLASDGAIVNRMSTAMQSRMIHFELALSVDAWTLWAQKAGIDFRIIAYINYKPDQLQAFDPAHSDRTFPCPRTWDFLSTLVKDNPNLTANDYALTCGTVGEGAGREFVGFSHIFQHLPTIQQIIADPKGFTVPEEASIKYAISGLISNHFDDTNAPQLVEATERLPIEFQIITLQSVVQNNRQLLSLPAVRTWAAKNAKHLM